MGIHFVFTRPRCLTSSRSTIRDSSSTFVQWKTKGTAPNFNLYSVEHHLARTARSNKNYFLLSLFEFAAAQHFCPTLSTSLPHLHQTSSSNLHTFEFVRSSPAYSSAILKARGLLSLACMQLPVFSGIGVLVKTAREHERFIEDLGDDIRVTPGFGFYLRPSYSFWGHMQSPVSRLASY